MKNLLIISSVLWLTVDVVLLVARASDIIGGDTAVKTVALFGLLAFSAGLLLASTIWLYKITRE